MSKAKWLGPFDSPFVATSKVLVEQNIDTVEFSTHGMWNMCGEYDFFRSANDFVSDLCDFIAQQYNVVIQKREGGFYACYDTGETVVSCYNLYCQLDGRSGKAKHHVTFNGDVIASFISLDDALAFKRSKEE